MRRNKSRFRGILASPATLIVAVIILFFMVKAAVNIHSKSVLSTSKFDEVTANLAKLEAGRAKLDQDIQDISTKSGVEAEIREKYHAVGPGEQVAVIVNTDENTDGNTGTTQSAASVEAGGSATSRLATSSQSIKQSWWQRLLRGLGL